MNLRAELLSTPAARWQDPGAEGGQGVAANPAATGRTAAARRAGEQGSERGHAGPRRSGGAFPLR